MGVAKADDAVMVAVGGREVRVSHPEKLYFSREVQLRKLDIVQYFLSVAPGALRGIRDRPIVLKRFVNGAEAEPFYQKRAPGDLPPWMRTVTLRVRSPAVHRVHLPVRVGRSSRPPARVMLQVRRVPLRHVPMALGWTVPWLRDACSVLRSTIPVLRVTPVPLRMRRVRRSSGGA